MNAARAPEQMNRDSEEYKAAIASICEAFGWRVSKAALLDSDDISRARTDDAAAIWLAARATA
ncbi:hypothetical protein I6G56_26715 [Burkholderia humptydooensis]|uniref:Uncharacterized protein n=1 Tax=Burkholderia humptydooensis TaxID=430531 RepID=A0A7T2U562_9BURK|nr:MULTISPECIES: hypothetical protein [Burkholderia]AJY38559.1 hypothetical protein BW21_4780 [Burkholderia sp. 2002721687]QPS45738.1 hypothetical protein I6G56_26715 [Burkholderia humptydooensis]